MYYKNINHVCSTQKILRLIYSGVYDSLVSFKYFFSFKFYQLISLLALLFLSSMTQLFKKFIEASLIMFLIRQYILTWRYTFNWFSLWFVWVLNWVLLFSSELLSQFMSKASFWIYWTVVSISFRNTEESFYLCICLTINQKRHVLYKLVLYIIE